MAIAGAALLGEVHGPVASTKGIGPALTEFERCWRPVVEDAQASGRRAASSFLPKNHVQRFLRLDHQGNPCAGNRPCRGTPHRWQNRKVSIEGSGLPEGGTTAFSGLVNLVGSSRGDTVPVTELLIWEGRGRIGPMSRQVRPRQNLLCRLEFQ